MKGRLQIKRGSKGLAIALAIIIGLICLASAITGVFFRDYYYLAQKEQIRNPEKFQEYKKKEAMFMYICLGLAIFGIIILPLISYMYFYI